MMFSRARAVNHSPVYFPGQLYTFTVLHSQSRVSSNLEMVMAEQTTPKIPKQTDDKPTPIGRLTLHEVDLALAGCERTVKAHSDTVKAKLTNNASIPSNVLRELSRANAEKGRLMTRRIALL